MAQYYAALPHIDARRISKHKDRSYSTSSVPQLHPYNPTKTPKAAAPTATTAPAVLIGTAAAELTGVAAAKSPSACATLIPYCVAVAATPLLAVVVTTLVAVVLAVHPSQLVHGAVVLHSPSVQPGHSLPGHAELAHHDVHGPDRHAESVLHAEPGPQLPVPKGPQPSAPPKWCEATLEGMPLGALPGPHGPEPAPKLPVGQGGAVRVEGMKPSEAREAWIDDHWAGSGGKEECGTKGTPVAVGGLRVSARDADASVARPRSVVLMLKVLVLYFESPGGVCGFGWS